MRRIFISTTILILFVFAAVATLGGCAEKEEPVSPKPSLTSIAPEQGPAGSHVRIAGARFGDVQGVGVVRIGGEIAQIVAWTDTEISAVVPENLKPAAQGIVVVTANGESDEVNFEVTGEKAPEREEGHIEHVTSVQAMLDWLAGHGIDSSGWTFSVANISKTDPNWKLDVGRKQGQQEMMFVLHKEGEDWVVKAAGHAIKPGDVPGMPGDLVEGPTPDTQAQAISAFLEQKGIAPVGWSLTVTKVSYIDPHWEVVKGEHTQMPTLYFVLYYDGTNWEVKDFGEEVKHGNVPDEPADIP